MAKIKMLAHKIRPRILILAQIPAHSQTQSKENVGTALTPSRPRKLTCPLLSAGTARKPTKYRSLCESEGSVRAYLNFMWPSLWLFSNPQYSPLPSQSQLGPCISLPEAIRAQANALPLAQTLANSTCKPCSKIHLRRWVDMAHNAAVARRVPVKREDGELSLSLQSQHGILGYQIRK